jgi:hypothetical protein
MMDWRNPTSAALRPSGIRRLVLVGALAALAGCEGKLAKISDADLQDRMYECNTTVDQAPGMAISCDNYRRECHRRRDEGRFVC